LFLFSFYEYFCFLVITNITFFSVFSKIVFEKSKKTIQYRKIYFNDDFMNKFMKWLFWIFVFLLPLHALLITIFQCRLGLNTNVLRFRKEIFVAGFLLISLFMALKQKKWSLGKVFQWNNLIGTTTFFILLSLLYIFFPYLEIKPSSLLGFKYDVFFFFCLIIGFYISSVKKNLDFIYKSIFASIALILVVFLPWYLSWDISSTTKIFWYSDKVSFYESDECLSFSQNVDGHNRFQATFWGPIRFSVYLVIFYLIYLGYILDLKIKDKRKKYIALIIPSIFVIVSIFFSYSKTSFLGLIFGGIIFGYLANKFFYHKSLKKKYIITSGTVFTLLLLVVMYIKRNLFLHLGSMINRLDNLWKSVEMFFYNPIGYGLGIAGPATQIGRSIESAGWWEISTASPSAVSKFLPENWFVQILLEQGIMGLFLFSWLLFLIGYYLFQIIKKEKNFLSIWIFTAFISLAFMWLFTHSFEESATSYTLFLIIWAYISNNLKFKK